MKKWRCDVVKQCCEGYSFIWVSDKLKSVWYEIPRCGSTATKTLFRENPEYGFKLLYGQPDPNEVFEKYKDYYKFTIGRNPWDRVVSNYNLYSKMEYRVPQTLKLFNIENINDFTFEFFLDNFQNNVNHHWEPCHKYFPDNEIDYYGKLDSIDEDWYNIRKAIGIEVGDIPKPKDRNYFGFHSGHGDYTDFYNEKSIELISDIYKKDIELFGFEYNKQKRV